MSPHPESKHKPAGANHGRRWAILGSVVGAALAIAAAYWLHTRNEVSTDDAFVDARIVPITARVRGYVQRVAVLDNQRVAAGDLLVELDPVDFEVRQNGARAELKAAEAEAKRARLDVDRYQQLLAKEEVSRQTVDRAVADASVADARVDVARQRQAEADRNLAHVRLTAPVSGHVTRRMVEVSGFVEEGQTLLAVVPDQVFITANFKETQITRVRPGDRATIRIDALGGRAFKAHVDSIQDGTGSRFSLFPPENASGNFIKVVQRVPVKIVFDELPSGAAPLAPGLSVVATVTVK